MADALWTSKDVSAEAQRVVSELVSRSWLFGVAVLLSPGTEVDCEGFEAGGYFDEDAKVIAIATGRQEDTWLGTLIHEYCHLTQWVEQQPLWFAYRDDGWEWLAGKSIRNPVAAIKSMQALEEDCERRALRLAKEINAPINIEKYTRAANAYLHFHNVMAAKRKWVRPGVAMSEIPEVLAAANPTLDKDFYKTPIKLRKQLEALL